VVKQDGEVINISIPATVNVKNGKCSVLLFEDTGRETIYSEDLSPADFDFSHFTKDELEIIKQEAIEDFQWNG